MPISLICGIISLQFQLSLDRMFGNKTAFSKKDLDYQKAGNSPAIKKIMADKDIARALDEPRERQELLDRMKSEAKGGSLSKEGWRRVLGYLRLGKGRSISEKEAYETARKSFSLSGDRYVFSSGGDFKAKTGSLLRTDISGRGLSDGYRRVSPANNSARPVVASRSFSVSAKSGRISSQVKPAGSTSFPSSSRSSNVAKSSPKSSFVKALSSTLRKRY